ncbi:MAG: hypothetical protein HY265_03695 [Deltaproteobacteria bacterium]|nr:hypothetical protein [Deltaproteobacteria bacterium]
MRESKKVDSGPYKEFTLQRKKQRALDKMVSNANARGEAEEAMVNFLVSELCLTMSAIMGHTHKYKLLIGGLVGPDLAMFDEFLTAILTPGQRIMLSESLFNKAVSEIERKMASEGEDNLLPKELAACVDGIKTACGKSDRLG